jgi:hypothetical protein
MIFKFKLVKNDLNTVQFINIVWYDFIWSMCEKEEYDKKLG